MTDVRTMQRQAGAAAIDRLVEHEGCAELKARLASVERLDERLRAIYAHNEARLKSMTDYGERTLAERAFWDELSVLGEALHAAQTLPTRMAVALAGPPPLPEEPRQAAPPPERPQRPKARLIRQR
jgi:hypothetical protein